MFSVLARAVVVHSRIRSAEIKRLTNTCRALDVGLRRSFHKPPSGVNGSEVVPGLPVSSVLRRYSSIPPPRPAEAPLYQAVGGRAPSGLEMARKLVQHVWPKGQLRIKGKVLTIVGLLVSAKLINASVPFLLREIINYYNKVAPESSALSVDVSATQTIITTGVLLILGYGFARMGSSLFNELRNALFAQVSQRSIRDIARKIFLHLHNLDLSFHLSRQTGALAKAIDRGTSGMSFTLNALVFNVIPTIFEFGLVGTIFYKACGPQFALCTAGCLGMYGVATIGITRWRTKYRHQMNEADNQASNRAIDSLINYETVKYFNNEAHEAERYGYFQRRYEAASLKTSSSLSLLNFVQNVIFSSGLIGVMCLAAQSVGQGAMTVGDLILVNTLLFQLSIPLNFLGSVYREVRQGMIDMQMMFSLLELKSKIIEKPNAPSLVVSPAQSSIIFKDVTFGYVEDSPPILNHLSFEIPPGKKVAIIGGSGSGKSTIVRLLYRLYDVESGRILINNQDISAVSLTSLRKAIAVVPQDTVLFHDTLLYNIHYGNISAPTEEVYEASRTADLHSAVLRMPNGYETVVGERGLKLSGGEKQRVSIARAILKNADIIIYDEATSSLDALTEEHIMNSLKEACRGKTSLFIAHRLATIVDSDIIYVLENGAVAEAGKHQQLLSKPGSRYADLWNSQHRFGAEPKAISKSAAEEERLQIELDQCCGANVCNR